MSSQCDVVIVGGGLAGSSLALALDRQGLDVVIVERGSCAEVQHEQPQTVHDFDARVSAVAANSWQFLGEQGLDLPSVRRQAYRSMQVWDGEGTGFVQFDAAELQVSELGAIVENSVLLAALHDKLKQSRVRTLMQQEINAIDTTESEARIELKSGQTWSAQLLVGADGALSIIRQYMGVDVVEWPYGQSAIVATLQTERMHEHVARQWFLRTGPLAFLPLSHPSDQFVSLVWSAHEGEAERLMQLEDADFMDALAHKSEIQLGAITGVSQRICVPLRQRHAMNYQAKRCVLVGDAAHTIHPLAGQGINLGFADVSVLAEELGRAASKGLDLGSTLVLARYQRRRKTDNLVVAGAMEGFVRLFDQHNPVVRWLRNAGMSTFNQLSPVKRKVAKIAMGLA
jgi:2-octaprenylphenol hydroxylase